MAMVDSEGSRAKGEPNLPVVTNDDVDDERRIQLRPAASRSRWIWITLAAAAFLAVPLQSSRSSELLPLAVYSAIAAGLWALYRRFSSQRQPHAIELTAEALILPVALHSRRVRAVPYRDVLTIEHLGKRGRGAVFIGTRQWRFVYPERAFLSPAPVMRLRMAIVHKLLQLPDGATLSAELQARGVRAARVRSRPVTATWKLLAIIALAFAIQRVTFPQDPWQLLRLGGNAPLLVVRGQLYRLCTANLLHVGLLHLAMNALALFWVGTRLERLLGSAFVLAIFLSASIGGALLSALGSPALVSVGASTGIFGLIAALAVVSRHFAADLSDSLRLAESAWLSFFAGSVFQLFDPQVDWRGHLGGLVTGAALAYVSVRGVDLESALRRSNRPLRFTAIALSGVFVASCVVAGVHAADGGDSDARLASEDLLNERDPAKVNAGAWAIAISTHSTAAELDRAASALGRVLEVGERSEICDTLATLQYRRGQYHAAIADELIAVDRGGPSQARFYRSQLARFLRSQAAHGAADASFSTDHALSLAPVATSHDALALGVSPPLQADEQLEVFAFGVQRGRTVGLLMISPSASNRPECAIDPHASGAVAWPSTTRFEIGFARRGARHHDTPSDCPRWSFTAMDPAVAVLP
jgi:rhomboid protease GluP